MFRNLEITIALRYLKSVRNSNAINIISWISVVAISVVTAALLVVFSVFNGFEGLVKSLYNDFYPDFQVRPAKGKWMHLSKEQLASLRKLEGVRFAVPIIEEKAVLSNGPYQCIATVRGLDDGGYLEAQLGSHLKSGRIALGTVVYPALVAGMGVYNSIGMDVEKALSPLVIYVPDKHSKKTISAETLHSSDIVASGGFAIQQEIDVKYAFTNLGFFKYLLGVGEEEYSFCDIKIRSSYLGKESEIQKKIEIIVGKSCIVLDRYEQNQSLFAAISFEKWIIYAITILILVVASFNIIGVLTMVVLQKQKDIAVLSALGLPSLSLKKIFLLLGLIMSLLGFVAGSIVATIICILQEIFHFVKIGGNTFIVDYYPVKMLAVDYIVVFFTVVLIALMSAYIPSGRAAKKVVSLK